MSSVSTPDVHLQAPHEDSIHAPNWNDPPTRLSRSPQPYRRSNRPYASPSQTPSRSNSYLPTPALTPSHSEIDLLATSGPPPRPPSRLDLETPGESGTEADDESFRFVKALPPPPLHIHKGLREVQELEVDDRLPTPKATQADRHPHKSTVNSEKANGEAQTSHQRIARGRLLQRVFEAACLAMSVWLTCHGLNSGNSGSDVEPRRAAAWGLTYTFILVMTLGSLLIRRFGKHLSNLESAVYLLGRIDPAPIFYPTMLPVLVALSLGPVSMDAILFNMILGLSSIPRRLVSSSNPTGYNMVHWMIAMTPILVLQVYQSLQDTTSMGRPSFDRSSISHTSSVDLSFLFPLHQALLSPIRYLTSSSLLSSEQHLLSIGLINLLFLASSPQIMILNIVLWPGGLGLLYFCRPLLKRNIALERIPTWRLKRAGNFIRASQTFLDTLSEGLRGGTSSENVAGRETKDEEHPPNGAAAGLIRKRAKHCTHLEVPEAEASVQSADNPSPKAKSPKRKLSSTLQSCLDLTPAQVNRRKWAYAACTYAVIIVAVLGPIRILVRDHALNGIDPFCWAVGYVFSDIPIIHSYISQPPLNTCIPIWPSSAPSPPSQSPTWTNTIQSHLHNLTSTTRLCLLGYLASILSIGIITVLALPSKYSVDTRRKIFHFTMVALLLPTSYIDPAFLSLGLILVLAVFLLLELLRAAQIRPLAKPLARFLSPYVDGRDLRGPIVISHIFLLVGCAVPFWLSCASLLSPTHSPHAQLNTPPPPLKAGLSIRNLWYGNQPHTTSPQPATPDPTQGWLMPHRDVSLLSGVICVGLGDAAASLVGRAIGRHKWPWPGGKSLEGSAAFAVAVTAGLVAAKGWLYAGGWADVNPVGVSSVEVVGSGGVARVRLEDWGAVVGKAAVAAGGASMTEAVLTGCNDNVVVPVVLWLWVRGLGL